MGIRLGGGEYERTDVEIKQSTLDARLLFLETLGNRKTEWRDDLLRLFNSEYLLPEFLAEEKYAGTFAAFAAVLANQLPSDFKIPLNLIDNPVFHYYSFINGKESLIVKLEKDEELQKYASTVDPHDRTRRAIRHIIPDWKTLKSYPEAADLCRSMEQWGKKQNLKDDWLLTFGLEVLLHFKLDFDESLSRFYQSENHLYLFYCLKTDYEIDKESSVNKAIFEYQWDKVGNVNWVAVFEDLETIPSFIYKYKGFELPSNAWVITSETRQQFCNKMRQIFNETKNLLENSKSRWNFDDKKELDNRVAACRNQLEIYCDEIESRLVTVGDESFIEFTWSDFGVLGIVKWYPSKQSRSEFIDSTLLKLRSDIEDYKKTVANLKFITKTHFEAKLTEYCNDLEKNLPPNFERTHKKNTGDKHFEWLIDYQVTPIKSYSEIAKSNRSDRKSVSEAIKDLSRIVEISLRDTKITGRPSGKEDSITSPRQLRIRRK